MRITRLDLQAFGCLKDFREDVAPGLHVFHGPNESGKSTLQRATLALLYGFYEGDRARGIENAARLRDTPWSDLRYGAQLEYELQDGRRYRVERDFANTDVPTILRDMVTGKDVTDDFGRGRHGNVQFMRRQVGMTKRVFEACAFVSQGELFEMASEGRATPQEMGDAIISLADTASRDVSAQSAINHLKSALQVQVGPTAQARTRPLQVARVSLAAATREMEEIDRVRAELAADSETLERLKDTAEQLGSSIARNRYLLSQTEALELKTRLNRLQDLDEEARRLGGQLEANQSFAGFPADERDAVMESWSTLRDLTQRLEADRPEIEKRRERIAELDLRREKMARRQLELAHVQNFPSERKPEIENLFRSWRSAEAVSHEATRRLEGAESGALAVLDEYRVLESEVGGLTAADVHALTERLRVLPSPPRRSFLLAPVHLVRIAWRVLVAAGKKAVSVILRRPKALEAATATKSATPANPYETFLPDAAAEMLARHRRYMEIAPIVRRHRDEVSAAQHARTALEAATAALGRALDGVVDVTDLESGYSVFQERCAQRNELESTIRRLESHDREAESLRDVIIKSDADEERLKRVEGRLRQQLETSVGRSGSLEELITAFETGCSNRRLYQEAKRALSGIDERRGMVLEGKSPSELEDAVKRADNELAATLRDNPEFVGARTNQDRASLKELVGRESNELREIDLHIRGLRTAIETKMSGLRSRAEVEEEIAQHTQEVSRLEAFGASLSVAIQTIDKAMTEAHRDFAPRVGRFLGDGLSRVTDGRYQEAYLDPADWTVTTKVPETGRLEEVHKLSQGTRAAAYLLLRAGLAQHMSSMAEPVPLILDDPLVDLDDLRLERFLGLLVELTQEVQVLLFTKDEATRLWFERNCADNPMHKISLLQRQHSPARVPA